MAQTFYWYDYETWGIDPRHTRPAQFAGIRTDLEFNTIGDPLSIYAKPTDDILPDPDAALITGITPQKALEEGYDEAEFAKLIREQLTQTGTVHLGFNTLRFDEAFNRYLFWRNFYDPFEHGWKNDCSAWDIIDMVRLTRALRPEGINWPEEDGKPTNRLEKLTVANEIEHVDAHDALSDVRATIAIAKLVKTNQPKLFNYLFTHRDKNSVQSLLDPANFVPVVHASDKFGSEVLSTAVVLPIAKIEDGRRVLVFDLKTDPASVLDLEPEAIVHNLFSPKADLPEGEARIGVKGIKINASPVLAPVSTVDEAAAERICFDQVKAKSYLETIKKYHQDMSSKLTQAFNVDFGSKSNGAQFIDAEARLYDGFLGDDDRRLLDKVVAGDRNVSFKDERLNDLLWHYKARNFPAELNDEERVNWQSYRSERLQKGPMNFQAFAKRLQELGAKSDLSPAKQHVLEQLQIYAESIYPIEDY